MGLAHCEICATGLVKLGLCWLTLWFWYTSSNDVSNKCARWSYHVLSRLTDDFHTEGSREMFSQGISYSFRKTLERNIRIAITMKTSPDVQHTKPVAYFLGFVQHLPGSFDSVLKISDIRAATPHVKTAALQFRLVFPFKKGKHIVNTKLPFTLILDSKDKVTDISDILVR